MASRKIKTIANIKNKVLGTSQKFLDSDFIINEGNRIEFSVTISDSLILEYTTNGPDYESVNNLASTATPQAANGTYRYVIQVSTPGLFNVRIKGGMATTLKSFIAELYLVA